MTRSDEYQRHAAELQREADSTQDPTRALDLAMKATIARAVARRTREQESRR